MTLRSATSFAAVLTKDTTAALDAEYDGIEADRVAKLARIKESAVAMNHLRVCWWNLASKYNCGRCEKCLRTMIGLPHRGRLRTVHEPAPGNPVEGGPPHVLERCRGGGELFARENLERLTELGETDTELVRSLSYAFNRNKFQEFLVTARFYVIAVGFGLVRYRSRKLFGSNRTRKPTSGSPPSRG